VAFKGRGGEIDEIRVKSWLILWGKALLSQANKRLYGRKEETASCSTIPGVKINAFHAPSGKVNESSNSREGGCRLTDPPLREDIEVASALELRKAEGRNNNKSYPISPVGTPINRRP